MPPPLLCQEIWQIHLWTLNCVLENRKGVETRRADRKIQIQIQICTNTNTNRKRGEVETRRIARSPDRKREALSEHSMERAALLH